MAIHPEAFEVLFSSENSWSSQASITVAITCYKYGKVCLEALDSLEKQTEPVINIIVIDDKSPDDSVEQILPWFAEHADSSKFGSLSLIRHCNNSGLSKARNTVVSQVKTPYTFVLDADNLVYPRALSVLRQAIENSGCAMAYSLIEVFGGKSDIFDNSVWIPEKFAKGNYIDAMALIRTSVLHDLDGYRVMPNKFGWEDYDFWCKMVDHGLTGCHVPQILCRYRSHPTSMVNTETYEFVKNKLDQIKRDFEKHHNMKFTF